MRTLFLTDRDHLVLLKLVRRAALLDPTNYGPLLDAVELDVTEHVDIGDEPVASRKGPRLTLVPPLDQTG